MHVTISEIEVAGPDRRARRLVFGGNEEPRLTSAAVVRSLHLQPHTEVDLAELHEQLSEAEMSCAHERALRIVSYRERSSSEVFRRLVDDGYPATLARELVDRFIELAFIDDARFAAVWVRTRQAAGVGNIRIARELADRGIDPELAARLLTAGDDGDAELARARAILRDRVPQTRAERERFIARLVRRGFNFSTAKEAVGEVRAEQDEGS